MSTFETRQEVHFEPTPFLIAMILMGCGALLAFLGVAVSGLHSVNQGVRWVRSWEHEPADLAKSKWAQLKAASAAGTEAWKGSSPSTVAHDGGQ
jgi:hypothetical protein